MSIVQKPKPRAWPRVRALVNWLLDSENGWKPGLWWWVITAAVIGHLYWILTR